MGYVVKPVSGTIETLQVNLRPADILTMGSTPIQLPIITGVINDWFYLPFNAFLYRTGGSTAYNFAVGDHPVISQGLLIPFFQWQKPIQDYNSATDIAIATYVQHVQSNSTYSRAVSYKISQPWLFSTITGNDATTGDTAFDLYIQALKFTF